MVEDGAERGGAVRAAIGLRHQNADVLNLLHGELTHLPQDLGRAELGGEKFGKVQFHIKMIGDTALHFGDPSKDLLDGRVRRCA